jgi:hypothetical protein
MKTMVDGVKRQESRDAWIRLAGLALFVTTVLLAAPARAQTTEPSPAPSWNFSGDFRLRWERTSDQEPTTNPDNFEPRHRWVVRFRSGITRQFGKLTNFGVRVTTGQRGDPNSTDITLGDFADRLEMSFDRAYLELKHKGAFLTGGKFANPFTTSELVWDGDVNPQGVAGSIARSGKHEVTPKLTGIFYVVDEDTINPDSYMAGGQGQVTFKPSSSWSIVLASAYYDYTIKSLHHADSGDTRGNRLTPDGTQYLSDFDLLDTVLTVDHRGFGERFPVRFVADYVKNLGADTKDDGFGVDLFVGRASTKGDLRFRYGYSQAETDAVLAAFSHDNTTLATNYRQHTVTFDYQVLKDMQLNATWYVFSRLSSPLPTDWITRLRLNAMVSW